jgi:uncharacterized repeat protein (TIGR03803 family)
MWETIVTKIAALLAVGMLCSTGTSLAQTYSVLYNFGGPGDGNCPGTSLVQSGNTLYGTTFTGGSSGNGTIFAFDTINKTETVLYSFAGGTGDGSTPASLLQSGTILYGTSMTGGSNRYGTAFAYDLDSNVETVLHSFFATDDVNTMILPGNTLYGTTNGGSGGNKLGTVFSLDPTNRTYTVAASFSGSPSDGSYPVGALVQSGKSLYGLTSQGGSSGNGAIFAFDTKTRTETVQCSLGGPVAVGLGVFSPTHPANTLYGMTYPISGGAAAHGTLFAFNTDSNTYTVLYSFPGATWAGMVPVALVQSGSILYGMTDGYGFSSDWPSGNDVSTIFAFDLDSNTLSVLDSISVGPEEWPSPGGSLILSGNTLFGTTFLGGANNGGMIFSLTVPEPATLAVLGLGGLALVRCRRRRRG